jgi:predicted transcriptional regulator
MKLKHHDLSRRERQIMDVIHARGEATAADVNAALPNAPSYSAVRALLRILEEKGFLKHREDGPRYVYLPTESPNLARRSALKRVVETFFEGSLANAVAALVDDEKLPPEEIARIESVIRKAKSK